MLNRSVPEQSVSGSGNNPSADIPQVGRSRRTNRVVGITVVLTTTIILFALLGQLGIERLRERSDIASSAQAKEATAVVGAASHLPDIARDLFVSKPPPVPVSAGADHARRELLAPEQRAQASDRHERRKRAPLLVLQAGGPSAMPLPLSPEAPIDQSVPMTGSIASALTPSRNAGVSARRLADPNLTITQGSLLDCALVTAISSQLAGMTACVLTRDVYSTNGRILLLERGSRLVGQYQSGQLRQGTDRIFVLWTRAETPNGIVIDLDSPATDSLGRSGLTGEVNHHFWLRFGSALLVSVVDDVAKAAANKRRGNQNTIQFGGTTGAARDSASIIVENTVNIPPTLDVSQGSRVGIFVARDLDFRSVYSLKPGAVVP
ncbi:type IV secretion system protein VirB10 [Luteibacter rhizovicinus]|uniref:Type IV secretion system protein VirB10 n=1 Tax=Luteibacter rhizovicinus TaxID=242606 RepID=A0A4R3YUA1_9GAMM|nr:type IV secretion system protein VirB10 [Luteibacter rhizovicinus]TCV94763.1 type IV secretion system protein VirB10 [Luteibacter rhizovicinus]